MTDGLNAKFMRDPVAFLDSNDVWDINSTGIDGQFKPIYKLDSNNVGTFDLYRTSNTTVNLRDKSAVSFWATSPSDFFTEPYINAYYLNSLLNKTNSMALSNHADYFFTDTITGCSFMAYGNDRHKIVAYHANAFEPAKALVPLATQEVNILNLPCPVKIAYGSSKYRNYTPKANTNPKPEDVVLTIIGWRRSDGWHFYGRRRINGETSTNRYVLDAASFEL